MIGQFWDHLTIWEKAKWLVANWDNICQIVESFTASNCAVIDRRCQVTLL